MQLDADAFFGGAAIAADTVECLCSRAGQRTQVLYEIDDTKHVVIVLDIRHRSAAYRLRK